MVMEPLPVPLVGVSEIQLGEVALHAQVDDDAAIPIVELPPPEPNDRLPGVIVKLHGGKPAWLTAKLWPATVIVPLRG